MPWYVIDALRDNPDVSLVIDWNGGDTVIIPAGKAQPKDPTRIYWPLSLLAELYKLGELPKDNPETGDPGNVVEIVVPDGNATGGKPTEKRRALPKPPNKRTRSKAAMAKT